MNAAGPSRISSSTKGLKETIGESLGATVEWQDPKVIIKTRRGIYTLVLMTSKVYTMYKQGRGENRHATSCAKVGQ